MDWDDEDSEFLPEEDFLPTVELPASGVSSAPLVCIQINESWLKVLLALASILEHNDFWIEGTDLDAATQQAYRFYELIVSAGVCEGASVNIPVGGILPFGGNTVPGGWLLCDGTDVSRVVYADLFAVIGTAYGVGDGVTTFNLPDLRRRVPAGAGEGEPDWMLGEHHGEEKHTLTIYEMPEHDHIQRQGTGAAGPYPISGQRIDLGEAKTGKAGGNQPHNNVQPITVCNFIIYAGG